MSVGHPDEEPAREAQHRLAVARLVLSADIEAGAVKINIEDSTGDPDRPLADVSLQCGVVYPTARQRRDRAP